MQTLAQNGLIERCVLAISCFFQDREYQVYLLYFASTILKVRLCRFENLPIYSCLY